MNQSYVQSWLQNPNYDTGLAIIKHYIDDNAVVFLYECYAYQLSDMIELIRQIGSKTNSANHFIPKHKSNEVKLPKHIAEMLDAAKKSFSEKKYLQSVILQKKSQKQRKKLAKEILDKHKLSKEYFAYVDEYIETGKCSYFENKVIVIDEKLGLVDIINKLKNIPGYITKFKKQLANADTEKTAYLLKMIAEKEKELEVINQRLNFLNDKIIELCL